MSGAQVPWRQSSSINFPLSWPTSKAPTNTTPGCFNFLLRRRPKRCKACLVSKLQGLCLVLLAKVRRVYRDNSPQALRPDYPRVSKFQGVRLDCLARASRASRPSKIQGRGPDHLAQFRRAQAIQPSEPEPRAITEWPSTAILKRRSPDASHCHDRRPFVLDAPV